AAHLAPARRDGAPHHRGRGRRRGGCCGERRGHRGRRGMTPAPADPAPAPLKDVLRARAAAWIADDPDPAARAALTSLLEQAEAGAESALEELRDAFAGDLEFGTA